MLSKLWNSLFGSNKKEPAKQIKEPEYSFPDQPIVPNKKAHFTDTGHSRAVRREGAAIPPRPVPSHHRSSSESSHDDTLMNTVILSSVLNSSDYSSPSPSSYDSCSSSSSDSGSSYDSGSSSSSCDSGSW